MQTNVNRQHQNKRQFSRVEAHLPIEMRFVPPDESQNVLSRLEEEIPLPSLPPDVADPVLADWLKVLNNKLDILIGMQSINQEDTSLMRARSENISGGGLSFVTDRQFSRGDVCEVKIKLSPQAQALHLYGTVINSSKRADGYLTSLQFVMLNDAIRDAIIKFVFEREREILRERRKD